MRDAHQMKEKSDVALDNRQLVTAFTGGLVVLGAVFVLGVVVGKKLSPEVTGTPIDLLTALDKKNDVLENAREQPLTFQDELTRKAPDRVAADAGPLAAPSQLEVGAADAGAPPDKTTVLAEGPKISLPTTEPVKAADVATASSAPVEPTPTAAKPAAQKPTPTVAKQEMPKPAAPLAAAKVDRVPASPSDLFTLQLAATSARSEADRQVAKLKGQGFSPYVEPAQIPGKGTWYRVRMGKFETREAATRFLSDFKRETKMNAFVAAAR
ncbi:MAG: SPOR domain-containing protein [Myxococcaceae bacterium]